MINNKYWRASELYHFRQKINGKEGFHFICNIHSPFSGVYYLRDDICSELIRTDDYNIDDDDVFITITNDSFEPEELGKINWQIVFDNAKNEFVGFISLTDSFTIQSIFCDVFSFTKVSLKEAIDIMF